MRNDASALLDVAQMNEADRLSGLMGVAGITLMENAGAAVFEALQQGWPQGSVLVLCGPGNNGGDGFVAARLLVQAGRQVRVALLGAREDLKGDARHHADLWRGDVLPLDPAVVQGADIVVDALLGSGLRRPLSGPVLATLAAVHACGAPIVAVDVPSGVSGDTGASWGAVPCAITVTFFRKKPGHLLLPARALCGAIVVADIGTPAAVFETIEINTFENTPALWSDAIQGRRITWHTQERDRTFLAQGGAPSSGVEGAWPLGPSDVRGATGGTSDTGATSDAGVTRDTGATSGTVARSATGTTGDALAFARAASHASGTIVVVRDGDGAGRADAVCVGAVRSNGADGHVLEWSASIDGGQAALIVAAPDGRAAILSPGARDSTARIKAIELCSALLPDRTDAFLATCAAVHGLYHAD
jgi:hydroxyethylthiazole kinase-like uncharacterized protein yjeF